MRTVSTVMLSALAMLAGACAVGSKPAPGGAAAGESWAIDAELVECCCCDPICPCLVGSSPTRGHCLGNRLVTIESGHFGGVALDGISVVLTFKIGEWSKLYVDDAATDEQVVAVRQLLERQWASLFTNVLEIERVPVTFEKDETTISFAVPAAVVELELMTGAGDRAIEVLNLRSFRDYVQYKARTLTHTADDASQSFEFTGTNGFLARHTASS